MATTSARSDLTREGGRAVATARGLYTVVDSPPPLGGPNEAMNEAEEPAGHFKRRCPVFTTLEKAAPIELTVRTA